MKRFLNYCIIILFTALTLASMQSCILEKESEPEPHTQTLIFYFAGTDLTLYYYNNISAIKDALRQDIKGKSRVVMLFQASNKKSASIIELTYNKGLCEEKILGSVTLPSAMNADDLGDILSRIIELAPGDSYSLIIGSHGLGWIPFGANPDDPEERSSLRSVTQPDDFWQQSGDIKTRFIGEASNPENAFNITTLAEAIEQTGVKFEYILFDACFMANVESAYDLRNSAKYIIGSVCEIMGEGFPYADILPKMLLDNGTRYDLDGICQSFHSFYESKKGYSGSISLIDCSQMEALAGAMRAINNGAKNSNYKLDYVQFYEGQPRHVFFDLGDYVNEYTADAELKAAFDEQMRRTVVKAYTLSKYYSAYGNRGYYNIDSYSGLNTSAPASVYQSHYIKTAWYKATH